MADESCRSINWVITFCVKTTCDEKIQNFKENLNVIIKKQTNKKFCEMITILCIVSHNVYVDEKWVLRFL